MPLLPDDAKDAPRAADGLTAAASRSRSINRPSGRSAALIAALRLSGSRSWVRAVIATPAQLEGLSRSSVRAVRPGVGAREVLLLEDG
jgi:hypothetical protein